MSETARATHSCREQARTANTKIGNENHKVSFARTIATERTRRGGACAPSANWFEYVTTQRNRPKHTRDGMTPLSTAPPDAFTSVRFVLTDMDDTLTHHGKLPAAAYTALERLQAAGIKVIPVTAAPAGWCDQMVRMWPVDAVIGENGGFYCRMQNGDAVRRFWVEDADLEQASRQLDDLKKAVGAAVPSAVLASDQPFRLTTIAWQRPSNPSLTEQITAAIEARGASTTVNSLWVLAWLGDVDKLKAARRMMREVYALDIDAEREAIVYVGDSENDAPMFAHFPKSVGVSTVVEYLHKLPKAPTWITQGPGGAGFVEVAEALLAARLSA